jgi:fumarate hydratase class I
MNLKNSIFELYKDASLELPIDIVDALKEAEKNEDGMAKRAIASIIKNIGLAKTNKVPICQDTGMPIFYVEDDGKFSRKEIVNAIDGATKLATEKIPLRANAVDTLTGIGVGNKPVIHFEDSDKFRIKLLLKGGGSENVTQVYSLPNPELKAERTLEGASKCVLDAVYKAQGKGCPPYILGVAIGGNIEETLLHAKKQLLRKIDDENENKVLNEFEKDLFEKTNALGIGPLGLGGKTTVLAVKAAALYRHPATYFVGVSFGCWSSRKGELKWK